MYLFKLLEKRFLHFGSVENILFDPSCVLTTWSWIGMSESFSGSASLGFSGVWQTSGTNL